MSTPEDSTVSLEIRYTERDYVRALRSHFASRLRIRLDIFLSFIVFVAGSYLWFSSTFRWLGVLCMVVSVLMVLLLFAAFVVIPPIAFRREPKFRDDYSLTFSREGIHFRTTHVDSTLQWSLYSRALIDAHSYVLYYGSRHFTLIPRRVFENARQRQAFERLLYQHIAQIVRVGAVEEG